MVCFEGRQECEKFLAEYVREVYEEAERYKQEYSDDWWREYLNNLKANLPGGWRRKPLVLDWLKDDITGASERLRTSTNREFFADIDEAIKMCGLSVSKIEELVKPATNAELYEYVLPAAAVLLWMGYKREPDLWG